MHQYHPRTYDEAVYASHKKQKNSKRPEKRERTPFFP